MITKFKKSFEPIIAIIAYPFLSWNPHVLTLLSVLSAVLFALFLANHLYFLAAISWLGVIFDALDGYVARKREKATYFGAFLDSTMDRIADFFYITAFGWAGLISWPIVSLIFLTMFLISYIKARGENLLSKSVQVGGIMQRTERLVLLFIIFLCFVFGLQQIAFMLAVLLLLLMGVTVIQRVFIIGHLLE